MAESSEKKMVTLKSSNGETFEVEEIVALQSQTIKHMIEDGCAVEAIPIANVTSTILAKVIEYCKNHSKVDNDEELKAWDAEYVKMDKDTLYDVILAANFLDIKSLLDLTCQTVANMIKAGETRDEIRKMFNIVNDFTPEEEEEFRRENQWTFDGW